MNRPVLSLILLAVFFTIAFGLRTLHHWRATKTTGLVGIAGPIGSARWTGGVFFVLGIALAFAAPIAQLVGVAEELIRSKPPSVDIVAVAVALIGIGGTCWAQMAMGTSWRIGVREEERTDLVGGGPFRWVRNPIFTFMLITAAGLYCRRVGRVVPFIGRDHTAT